MKRLLTILLLIVSVNVFGQIMPAPSGTLTPLTTNQAYFRASDSTYYFYNGVNYLWNYFLNKKQADKLYQPLGGSSPVPFSLSSGYGLVGSSFDGSVARTWTADTASAGGLVSKSRLATNLGGYVPSSRTITINGATRDLSANRTFNVGTVLSVGATAGTGISISGSPITSSGSFVITNTAPSPVGVSDSLLNKANKDFSNVASGAIAKSKVDTTSTGLQTVSNFFPKGDTRYAKIGDIPTQYWQRSGGTLSPVNSGDSINIGTGIYKGHALRSDASDGVQLQAANGTLSATFGVGNTNNASIAGSVTVGGNIIKTGGTSQQALMADGSLYNINNKLDTSAYKRPIIYSWGDSMTAGTGSTSDSTYTNILSSLVGAQVINRGVPGETSTQIKNRMVAATASHNFPTIIWAGRNNYSDSATVIADIATMVSKLPTKRYLILGITNSNPGEPIGNSGYDIIVATNKRLSEIYQGNFIDIRKFLVNSFNPNNAQDVIDYSMGLPPSSLLSDNIHLNNKGYMKVAERISQSFNILNSSSILYNYGGKIQPTAIQQFTEKGIEIYALGNNGYIDNYNRYTSTPDTLTLQYNGGRLNIHPFGGTTLSQGIIQANGGFVGNLTGNSTTTTSWGGSTADFGLEVDSILKMVAIQSGGVLKAANKSQVQSWIGLTNGTVTSITPGIGFTSTTPITTSGTLNIDTASTIVTKSWADRYYKSGSSASLSGLSVQAGGGIISGGGVYSISPSATRGVIAVNGSGDQFLTFGSNGYLFGSSTLLRINSTPDFDIVAGGLQRLLISSSTGAATFSSLAGSGTRMVVADPSGVLSTQPIPSGGGGGSVTGVAVATANGLSGTSDGATVVPTLTLSTTVSGMVKANGSAFSAAVAGTDYTTPSSTETFTNKSGNISQWTNNSGYITSAALSPYAPLNSPTFTGTPTLPTGTIGVTQTQGDNSTKLATTAYVDALGGTILGAQKQIATTYTNVSTSGTSEETLFFANIAQSNLSNDGDRIDFNFVGAFGLNANDKYVSISVGGNLIPISGNASNKSVWEIDGYLMRTSSTTFRIFIRRNVDYVYQTILGDYTVTDFNPLNFQILGQTNNASFPVTVQMGYLQSRRAP